MPQKVKAFLLSSEVVLCFALPMYLLFWGVLSAPLWIDVVRRGGNYAWWHLFDIVAGCLGVIGLFYLLRFCLSKESTRPLSRKTIVVLAALGLLALWEMPTQHFSSLDFDPYTLIFAVLPTLCTAHLLVLALLRARCESPNTVERAPA